MTTVQINFRTAHYEIKTENSTYWVRVIPGGIDSAACVLPDQVTAWSDKHRAIDIDGPIQCGAPMFEKADRCHCGQLRTSPVRSIRKISSKAFKLAVWPNR